MGTVNPEETFVLMLSSGERPRYRDDIVRVMALPDGGRLQFRYREKHVLSEVFRKLSDNGFSGCEALVAYLDTSNQNTPPEIVPCRFCRILDSEAEGEFVVIRFEVGGFAEVRQHADIRTEVVALRSQDEESLPDWEDGSLKGHFVLALKSGPTSCQSKQDRRVWQAVVENLGGRGHFRDSPFFYNLRRVVEEGPETEVRLREGKYVLKPDKIYRAEVVHYMHPATAGQRGGPWGRLDVEAKGNGVQPMMTQHLSVDSPYDVKRVYFRTTGEVSKQYALLSFARRVILCPTVSLDT
jgi:hypothetical protein